LNDEKNAFVVDPGEVEFRDYQVNELYEIPLKITNRSSISKRLKYIPPKEYLHIYLLFYREYFSVRNVKYPSSESGLIAPGMSLVLYIQFAAPSFADFDDFLTVITEENSFKVISTNIIHQFTPRFLLLLEDNLLLLPSQILWRHHLVG
jgi:hypothetical protein